MDQQEPFLVESLELSTFCDHTVVKVWVSSSLPNYFNFEKMVDKQDYLRTWEQFKEMHLLSTSSPFQRDYYLAKMCYLIWFEDSIKTKPEQRREPADFWLWLNLDGRRTQMIHALS